MKMSQNEAVSWNFWGIIRFSINIILKIVGHSRWNCFSNLVFVSHIARKAEYRMPKYLPKSNQNHHGITIKMRMSPCLKRRWESLCAARPAHPEAPVAGGGWARTPGAAVPADGARSRPRHSPRGMRVSEMAPEIWRSRKTSGYGDFIICNLYDHNISSLVSACGT